MTKAKKYRIIFGKSVTEKIDQGIYTQHFRKGSEYYIYEPDLNKLLSGEPLVINKVVGHGHSTFVKFDLSYIDRIEEDVVSIVYSSK